MLISIFSLLTFIIPENKQFIAEVLLKLIFD